MKLYGLELELNPSDSTSSDALTDALDALHESIRAHSEIYSVDIALEDSTAYILVGIQVDDADGAPAALDAAVSAVSEAIRESRIQWRVDATSAAREMALAN